MHPETSETPPSAPDADVSAEDVLQQSLDRWREVHGRPPTGLEREAIAMLVVEFCRSQPADAASREGVRKGAVGDAPSPAPRLRGRYFRPADERRHRAVLQAPPRSPQAERMQAEADLRASAEADQRV